MNQLENYDKVSDLVVEISLYFSPFAYDVLQYVILLRMASGRQALQQNGVNVTMWVQRIAVFISSLAKHTPKMNISNIINLVLKKLHDGDMMAVTIIKELTSRVSGVKTCLLYTSVRKVTVLAVFVLQIAYSHNLLIQRLN